MGLKHLEHDGGEDFLENEFPDRSKEKQIKLEELQKRETLEERLEKENVKWNHPSNPALWDGEI